MARRARGDHGKARADERREQLALRVVLAQVLAAAEEDGVMGDDELRAQARRLLHHFQRQVQRHEHARDLGGRVAGQQARVVPLLLRFQRGDALQKVKNVPYRRHG